MVAFVEHYVANPWFIAALFVLFHSWRRFDTPPANRASTTPERYYVALTAYVFVSIASYALVALSPEFLHEIMPPAATPLFSEAARNVGAPFFGALFVTELLPMVPVISEPEVWLRGVLQDLAAIPYEAVRLSKRLRRAGLQLSDRVRTKITDAMIHDGIDRDLVVFETGRFDEGRSLECTWTRICALMYVLREWDGDDRRLVAFRRAFRGDWSELNDRYHQLKSVFSLVASSTTPVNDPKFSAALTELRTRFGEQMDALHKGICDFVAMGVLRCRLTGAQRSTEVKRLGFVVWSRPHRSGLFDKTIGLFLVFGVYFTVLMARFGNPDSPIGAQLLRGLTIAALYCAAVVSALYVARGTDVSTDGERPWSRYLFAGIVAAAVSIATNFGLAVVLEGSIRTAAEGFRFTLPWSLLAFVTAFATCFNCDTRGTQPWLRWAEGVGQAATTALAAIAVVWLLSRLAGHVVVDVPPLGRVTFNSFVAGFIIGSSIPAWYRRNREHGEVEDDLVEAGALAA